MENHITGLTPAPRRSDRMQFVLVLLLVGLLSVGAIAVVTAMWAVPTVKHLAEQLRESDDPVVRCRAAWWLGEHEDRGGVKECINGLRDRSASVRLVSAWALGEIKDHAAIDPLIDVLERDDDVLAREMAALALGEIEDPDAVDALVAAFDRDEDLRGAIVWALGEIENRGSRKAEDARVAAFEEWERRPWRNEQVWTGHLDKRRPDVEDLNDMMRDVKSRSADTRRDAALDLGFLGVHERYETDEQVLDAVDALIVALRDPVPEVRAAACWSLDEINPSRWGKFGLNRVFKKSGSRRYD